MTSAPTGALLDTCFRQIEYAGVLAGAKNPAAAQKVVDFMLSQAVAGGGPGRRCTSTRWTQRHAAARRLAEVAPVAPHPATLDPATIAANRDAWTSQWSDLMGR